MPRSTTFGLAVLHVLKPRESISVVPSILLFFTFTTAQRPFVSGAEPAESRYIVNLLVLNNPSVPYVKLKVVLVPQVTVSTNELGIGV